MSLTPHINDANRADQLKRKKLQPHKWGAEPLRGQSLDNANKEVKKLDANTNSK